MEIVIFHSVHYVSNIVRIETYCYEHFLMQIPGRVGDASIAGGGAYAESGIGGCASTGDGDLHLRFLPCYQVQIQLPSQEDFCVGD